MSNLQTFETLQVKPAGVIFDMDGTLLDTEPLYTKASQKVLDPFNCAFTMALKQQCLGGDSRRSAQIVIDHFALPLSAEEYLNKREVFLTELFADAPEITGAGYFIEQLKKLGIPFGLATSSHQHLCDLKLRSKTWGASFHQVIPGDHSELKRSKPHPDIFLLCAHKLGLAPEQCLAFEDSPSGVSAAISAGMKVIGINSPYIEPGGLPNTELMIDNYHQLDELLKTWQLQ